MTEMESRSMCSPASSPPRTSGSSWIPCFERRSPVGGRRTRWLALAVVAFASASAPTHGIAAPSSPAGRLPAPTVAAALAAMPYPDPTGACLAYQLCATQACQVYTGWAVSHGPDGDRWRQAVRSTRGQVLLSGGRPADALYSSTSPGYTIGNEKVFGGT